MVDVGAKDVTERTAVAAGLVTMTEDTRSKVSRGELDKGDALEVARIAGIMAAKRTPDLIPLCHPISLDSVDVTFEEVPEGFEVRATARASARTGVEMEALAAVTVAALTVYDMVKGIQRDVAISNVRLIEKTGGKSGDYRGA